MKTNKAFFLNSHILTHHRNPELGSVFPNVAGQMDTVKTGIISDGFWDVQAYALGSVEYPATRGVSDGLVILEPACFGGWHSLVWEVHFQRSPSRKFVSVHVETGSDVKLWRYCK